MAINVTPLVSLFPILTNDSLSPILGIVEEYVEDQAAWKGMKNMDG